MILNHTTRTLQGGPNHKGSHAQARHGRSPAKQLFGFADSSARKKEAVLRTAPFVGLCYTTLVLWCVSSADAIKLAAPPVRPWYPHKRGLSYADILRAVRRATGHEPIKRSPLKLGNLRRTSGRASTRQRTLEFRP